MPPRRKKAEAATTDPASEIASIVMGLSGQDGGTPVPARAQSFQELKALEDLLSSKDKVVREVIGRDLEERGASTGQLSPPPADPILDTLEKIVSGIKTGGDIQQESSAVLRFISNQESRSTLVDSMLLSHDYERLVRYAKARNHLEDVLLRASMRGDLSPTEALAFMSVVNAESKVLQARVRAGSENIKDIMALLEKADYALTERQVEITKRYVDTTPQGREIIRRLTHRLAKVSGSGRQPDKQSSKD